MGPIGVVLLVILGLQFATSGPTPDEKKRGRKFAIRDSPSDKKIPISTRNIALIERHKLWRNVAHSSTFNLLVTNYGYSHREAYEAIRKARAARGMESSDSYNARMKAKGK